MNAKQSLKLASARIIQLEDFNRRASAEIKALNACIDSVIAGEKTYCDWCEENAECQRDGKGTGCPEWWMNMEPEKDEALVQYFSAQAEGEEADGGKEDFSKSILSASPAGGK